MIRCVRRVALAVVALGLAASLPAAGATGKVPPAPFALHYNHAGLTRIDVAAGRLVYVWHTLKPATAGSLVREQSLAAYDRHERRAALSPAQASRLRTWVRSNRIFSLKPDYRARHATSTYAEAFVTNLSVTMDGRTAKVRWNQRDGPRRVDVNTLVRIAREVTRKRGATARWTPDGLMTRAMPGSPCRWAPRRVRPGPAGRRAA